MLVTALRRPIRCNFIPHLLPIDQTLHWANPELIALHGRLEQDCRLPAQRSHPAQPYIGPVPIVTHVHGAHVGPESDGYPEAWWLPGANNIPTWICHEGTLVNQYGHRPTNTTRCGELHYPNDQPSTTIWYHDHTLGMTRNNVYAGPAGFWLIREAGGGETGWFPARCRARRRWQAKLDPNCRPAGSGRSIREIPIVIQDRSFNADGSLFYPDNRAFFEGYHARYQAGKIPFIGDAKYPSDISPIWNPEAFFNTMVVNGVTWPNLDVEPDLYRFRLLNGCNSRFLNLAMRRCKPRRNDLEQKSHSIRSAPSRACCLMLSEFTGFKAVYQVMALNHFLNPDAGRPAAGPADGSGRTGRRYRRLFGPAPGTRGAHDQHRAGRAFRRLPGHPGRPGHHRTGDGVHGLG